MWCLLLDATAVSVLTKTIASTLSSCAAGIFLQSISAPCWWIWWVLLAEEMVPVHSAIITQN